MLLTLFLLAASLFASPRAIFDFDGVMTKEFNKKAIFHFLHETLQLSQEEVQKVYSAILSGQSNRKYWQSLAKEKKVHLSGHWKKDFQSLMKNSISLFFTV